MASGLQGGRSHNITEAELEGWSTQSCSVPITLFHVRDALQVMWCFDSRKGPGGSGLCYKKSGNIR